MANIALPSDVALLGDCALLTDVALPGDGALLADIALPGDGALLTDTLLANTALLEATLLAATRLADAALLAADAALLEATLLAARLADVALLAATLPALAGVPFSSLLPLRRQVRSTRRNALRILARQANAKPKMPALASTSAVASVTPILCGIISSAGLNAGLGTKFPEPHGLLKAGAGMILM